MDVLEGSKWQELFILLLWLSGKCVRQRGLNLLWEIDRQMGQEGQSLLTVFSGLGKNHFVPLPQVLIKQWRIPPYTYSWEVRLNWADVYKWHILKGVLSKMAAFSLCVCYEYFFFEAVLGIPDWPWTYCVTESDSPASTSRAHRRWVLELQVCPTGLDVC